MKQSIGLIILQVLSIVFGFYSIYWIASTIPPAKYAILGVQQVIASILLVFSNSGLESIAIRNVLLWNQNNQITRIKLFVTQAIFTRLFLAFLLQIPVFFYSWYLSYQQFDGQYFFFFILMGSSGVCLAVIDSSMLILRAFNKYLLAASIGYFIDIFSKVLGLIIFYYYGFNNYLYMIIFVPFIIIIPVFISINRWVEIKYFFKFKLLFKNIKLAKQFAFTSYFSFFFNFFDQFIVSLFLSPSLLGSFSIAKRILLILKVFIENIFDPLIQKLIVFKSEIEELSIRLKKIYRLQRFLLGLSLPCLVLFIIYEKYILSLIKIDNYPYIGIFVFFVLLSQIIHLFMKIKLNFIALFYKPSYFLLLNIFYSLISLIFFSILILINQKYIFLYIVLSNFVMFFTASIIYSKNKGANYLINNKQLV